MDNRSMIVGETMITEGSVGRTVHVTFKHQHNHYNYKPLDGIIEEAGPDYVAVRRCSNGKRKFYNMWIPKGEIETIEFTD